MRGQNNFSETFKAQLLLGARVMTAVFQEWGIFPTFQAATKYVENIDESLPEQSLRLITQRPSGPFESRGSGSL